MFGKGVTVERVDCDMAQGRGVAGSEWTCLVVLTESEHLGEGKMCWEAQLLLLYPVSTPPPIRPLWVASWIFWKMGKQESKLKPW